MRIGNNIFLLLATTFAIFIAAASAPSPLYVIFQQQWHFSAITLTIIFAVYALTFLLSLLFFGSLSDYIGRRPVLLSAIVVEGISMAVFALATSVLWLIFARLLQGFATGAATSVLSASLIDTQPKNKPGLAPLVSTIVPVGSVGIGAILTGLLVEYVIWPTHLIFWIICIVSILLGVYILFIPEMTKPKSGWLQSLTPTVSIPNGAKKPFMAVGPSLIASWALVGLYLSLGPSVVIVLLHNSNHLVGGLVILALTATGAISSFLMRLRKNEQLLTIGTITATVGLSITAYSIASSNTILFFVGTVASGFGFGPAFTGAFRSIMSQAPDDQRAGLASAVYIVSYLAFGIPAVLAGIASTKIGLYITVLAYTVGVIILYLLTFVLLIFNKHANSQSH